MPLIRFPAENPIKLPPEVLDGLQAVRKSGTTNMLDVPVVCLQAVALGYPETADWINENTNTYIEGVSSGFESESG